MATDTWKVYTYDSSLTLTGILDVWTSLDMTLQYNAGGVWKMVMPEHPQVNLLRATNRIAVARRGEVVMSGPVRALKRTSTGGTAVVEVSGIDDNAVLYQRTCYPDPANTADSQTLAYDVRSGPAETVMRGYVDANAGPGALPARQVYGLALAADQARGATVDGSTRFDRLGDVLQFIGTGVGLGWQSKQIPGGQIQVDFYIPEDRTSTVVFSEELGTLRGWSYILNAPKTTRALVAGQGEGAARTIVEVAAGQQETDWGMRVEEFIDARDTDTGLDQRGQEKLAEAAATAGLTINPIDVPGREYGVDYRLGDKVAVEMPDARFEDVITEVRLTVTPEGTRAVPKIGHGDGSESSALYDRVVDLTRRLELIERRL